MMKQISHVFLFELKSILRKPSVIITTMIFAVVLFLATSIPTIMTFFNDASHTDPDIDAPVDNFDLQGVGILIRDTQISFDEFEALGGIRYDNLEDLKHDVQMDALVSGFVITSPTSYEHILLDRSWDQFQGQLIASILRTKQVNQNLIDKDLDVESVYEAFEVQIDSDVIILGKDATSNVFISFFLMFAIYMLVIMYGSFVATSVAREKDNRTMEVLITSTKPTTLIIGKVFANALGGLAQFGFILGIGILGFFLNQSNYPTEIVKGLFQGLTFSNMGIFLLFTMFGYLLYLFIYASLGSLVSKIEDVNSTITPITLLFMVAYAISALAMEMPKNTIVKISSYIPFTSILSMPVRNFQMSIPWYELTISLVIMLLTTMFFAFISIRIYRMGSLNYGKKIKLSQAIKMIFTKA